VVPAVKRLRGCWRNFDPHPVLPPNPKCGFRGRGMCCVYENLDFMFSPISDLEMGEMSEGQRGSK